MSHGLFLPLSETMMVKISAVDPIFGFVTLGFES